MRYSVLLLVVIFHLSVCNAAVVIQVNDARSQSLLLTEWQTAKTVLSEKDVLGAWEILAPSDGVKSRQIGFGIGGSASISTLNGDGTAVGIAMSYRILSGSRLSIVVSPDSPDDIWKENAEEIRKSGNRLLMKTKSGYVAYVRVENK